MLRLGKMGAMLGAFLIVTFFGVGSTTGALQSPDVKVHAKCPTSSTGKTGVTVDPWLFEGTEGETSVWILTVNDKEDNRIVISAPFGDPDNWPFVEGSYTGHGKIEVPYSDVERTGEVFQYTITVDCEEAGFKVVIDPQIKIGGPVG